MDQQVEKRVTDLFADRDVIVQNVQVREYPEETNILVFVDDKNYAAAIDVSEEIEEQMRRGASLELLLVVRKMRSTAVHVEPMIGVFDSRSSELQRLIAARNRVSDVQPSLSYVRDLGGSLSAVSAQRHHLVFGRRGVGKSTLLVETRRTVELDGALTAWVNLQTLRREPPARIFLRIARDMVTSLAVSLQKSIPSSAVVVDVNNLLDRLAVLTKEKLGYRTLGYSVDLHRRCSSTRWLPDFRSSSLLSH